jgi:hypothetical protein
MYSSFLEKKGAENKFEKLISWCKKEAAEIFNLHQLEREEDLKMLKRYAEMYTLGSEALEVKVLKKASEIGLI